MSPEQATGGAVDERCEVCAVGCVLYEMQAGKPPFSGPTAQAVLARQLNSSPRSLRLVRPQLSPAMEAAVLSALERSPDRRPSSGSVVALDAGVNGQARHAPYRQVYGAYPGHPPSGG